MPFSRVCPFCNVLSTITDSDIQSASDFFYRDFADGTIYGLQTHVITCPSPECNKAEVFVQKWDTNNPENIHYTHINFECLIRRWELEPEANIKVFPKYVPESILQDYKEAKLIVNISPKASATISRRCLQTMIRDFWAIKDKKSLHHEIEAIKDKIDTNMYDAIMALKSIGNIGAHPEKDINIIVDVEPGEAEELVWLIETLIEDWYMVRHDRENRISKIKSINTEKQLERKLDPYSTN